MPDKCQILSDELSIIAKYSTYKSIDPFPDIPAALLNSADIHSYVNATGMMHPFEEKQLKSASYTARIAGECRCWDEENENFETVFLENENDNLVLRPNSIAFVGIEPTFRLPDYMALRFNLKISNVYRGLLLGTGPLIDPGFEGKISIPLHNLTNNEYVFSYGESLIWIEFTKTSPIPITSKSKKITKSERERLEKTKCNKYTAFPDNKKNKELPYYLGKALKGTSNKEVVSSIPSAIAETKKLAGDAKESADTAKNSAANIAKFTFLGTAVGAVAVVASIIGILWNSWSLQREYLDQTVAKAAFETEQTHKNDTDKLNTYISELENNLHNLTKQVDTNIQDITKQHNKTISVLKRRIEQLESKNTKSK